MPGTKAREAEVTGYVESGIHGQPDPYGADDRRIAAAGHVRFGVTSGHRSGNSNSEDRTGVLTGARLVPVGVRDGKWPHPREALDVRYGSFSDIGLSKSRFCVVRFDPKADMGALP